MNNDNTNEFVPQSNSNNFESASHQPQQSMKLPLDRHSVRIKQFRYASWLSVRRYRSARLGAEICYGILPEAY